VPTTAGTGSEATYGIVVKDWDRNQKLLYADNHMTPNTAILDPTMVAGLPPMLTATTGMDAFTHAVEAILALQCEPVTDALATHAIRLVMECLPRCVEKGDDLVARGQQQIAAYLGGVVLDNAQLGLAHAMAQTVGGLFGVPHGLANSIILPHVMMYNLDACPDRYTLIAQAMGLDTKGMSDEEAGEAAVNAVWDLTKNMGMPQKLRDAGVPEDGLEEAANLCMSDGFMVFNPKTVLEPEEVLGVYKNAW
jgi:alcohol dehydrogenase